MRAVTFTSMASGGTVRMYWNPFHPTQNMASTRRVGMTVQMTSRGRLSLMSSGLGFRFLLYRYTKVEHHARDTQEQRDADAHDEVKDVVNRA